MVQNYYVLTQSNGQHIKLICKPITSLTSNENIILYREFTHLFKKMFFNTHYPYFKTLPINDIRAKIPHEMYKTFTTFTLQISKLEASYS